MVQRWNSLVAEVCNLFNLAVTEKNSRWTMCSLSQSLFLPREKQVYDANRMSFEVDKTGRLQ